jgi:hypothetical protein
MLKEKLMNTFKGMFGGNYSKENGKVFWSKNGVKELVTTSFLKHFIASKKDPSSNVPEIVVSKTVNTNKPPSKKAKKDAKIPANPEVPEGS